QRPCPEAGPNIPRAPRHATPPSSGDTARAYPTPPLVVSRPSPMPSSHAATRAPRQHKSAEQAPAVFAATTATPRMRNRRHETRPPDGALQTALDALRLSADTPRPETEHEHGARTAKTKTRVSRGAHSPPAARRTRRRATQTSRTPRQNRRRAPARAPDALQRGRRARPTRKWTPGRARMYTERSTTRGGRVSHAGRCAANVPLHAHAMGTTGVCAELRCERESRRRRVAVTGTKRDVGCRGVERRKPEKKEGKEQRRSHVPVLQIHERAIRKREIRVREDGLPVADAVLHRHTRVVVLVVGGSGEAPHLALARVGDARVVAEEPRGDEPRGGGEHKRDAALLQGLQLGWRRGRWRGRHRARGGRREGRREGEGDAGGQDAGAGEEGGGGGGGGGAGAGALDAMLPVRLIEVEVQEIDNRYQVSADPGYGRGAVGESSRVGDR
ncbi:hypothetical protein B0H17DRAFT_1285268, partial [Mycena rosella]